MSRQAKWPLVLAGSIAAAMFLFRLVLIWSREPAHLASLTPDDAFYYYTIALNIASGGGSTFDGVTTTNGYHPLWMMLCSTVAIVGGFRIGDIGEHIVYLRVILTVNLLLGAAACAAVGRLVYRLTGLAQPAAIAVFFSLNPFAFYGFVDGMETAALVALMLWAAIFAVRFDIFHIDDERRLLAVGALLSLVFLARLDSIFFLAGIGLALVASGEASRSTLRRIAFIFLPVVLVAVVYTAINKAIFGQFMPISGSLKNTFPHPALNTRVLSTHPLSCVAMLLAVASLFFVYRGIGARSPILLAAAVYLLLHGMNILVFTDWGVHAWYFVPAWIWLGVAIALVSTRISFPTTLQHAAAVLLAIAAIGGQFLFFRGRIERDFKVRSVEAAEAVRGMALDGRLIGMTDAGVFGYFRPGLVMNMDGVVNDRAYQELLVRWGLQETLRRRGVRLVAHHAVPGESVRRGYRAYEYRSYSHLYNTSGGAIQLRESDELWRSEPFNDGTGEKNFVIWRLPIEPLTHSPLPDK